VAGVARLRSRARERRDRSDKCALGGSDCRVVLHAPADGL